MSRCRSCESVIDDITMKEIDGKWVVEDFCERCIGKYVYGVNSLDSEWVAHEHITELGYKGFTKCPKD